jgi:hypothetical protein
MLSGPDGYWTTLDWNHALTVGNATLDIPFSGEFDFVDTTYVFPHHPYGGPQGKRGRLQRVPHQ